MRGIARTILLLLCWGALQRWLLGIGLPMSIGGLVALTGVWHPDFQPLFALLVFLGMACVVISPVLVDGIVFRSLSAARATELIPFGRLKLVLGAFTSQLLVVSFLAAAVWFTFSATALTPPNQLGASPARLTSVFFVSAYALLSIEFMGLYWLSRFPFGSLWLLGYGLWPQLFVGAYKAWQLQGLFASSAGLAGAFAVILCGWLLFALLYLRARHISVAQVDTFLLFSGQRAKSAAARVPAKTSVAPENPRYSRRNALRTLLLGMPKNRMTLTTRVALWVALMVLFVGIPTRLQGKAANLLAWLPLIIVAGPIAGAFATSMTQRARTLWLASGLGRGQLFAEVERYSWRLTFIVTGFAVTLLVPQFVLGIRDVPAALRYLTFTVIPIASAAGFIYAGMSYVRGHRLAGALIVAVCVVFWLIDLRNMLTVELSTATKLLAVQIIFVPVLRLLALRQWQDLDWRLNRPKRLPVRLA